MNELLHLANPSQGPHQHDFSKNPEAEIQRSKFDRSFRVRTTIGSGFLVPLYADEIYPGDTVDLINTSAVIRMITPIVPIMDDIYCDYFWYFIPNRLIWTHWNNFLGAQANPGDSTSYIIPVVDTHTTTFLDHSPYDYMGVQPGITMDSSMNIVSALYGRAFNLTWNTWFRDQNLQNSLTVNTGDGPDTTATYQVYGVNSERLPRRGKRHDYITSALPWPQKINDGSVVTLPLGTTAPVQADGITTNIIKWSDQHGHTANVSASTGTDSGGYQPAGSNAVWTGGDNLIWTPGQPTGLVANLSTATAATINQLRLAITMQQLFERDARGGTRPGEIIRSHFGVTDPDARIQFPEYLGGGETPIQISAVPQTSATGVSGGTTAQGNLAAFAAGHENGKIKFTKSFVEHGVIILMASIRAEISYQQNLPRKFTRSTRYDFYWPTFANLGEQAINNYEVVLTGNHTTDKAVWGYKEAWSEMRYNPAQITAGMRSSASPSFAIWHLSQQLSSPALNATFIEDTPPINRVTAVSSTYDQFYVDIFLNMHWTRPLPMNSVPGLRRL